MSIPSNLLNPIMHDDEEELNDFEEWPG